MPDRRRGFILLFGSKNVVGPDPDGVVPAGARCPRCGHVGTLAGRRVRPWFTAFFIPVFPIGPGRRFTRCGTCDASFAVPPAQIATAAARSDAGQVRRGIALYNSLRNSPANSVTLNELMTLYAHAGEPRQAISAAAQFPAAVDASEQCMTTLGRVHLQQGDAAEAIRWFDRALARNPDLGDAHYHKAAAALALDPPDFAQAVCAARRARKAEHPGAEELLRDAESRERGA